MDYIVLIDRTNDALVAICPVVSSEDPLHTMSRHVRDEFGGLYAEGWEPRLPGTPNCYEIRVAPAVVAAPLIGRRLPLTDPGAPGRHVVTFATDLIGRLPGIARANWRTLERSHDPVDAAIPRSHCASPVGAVPGRFDDLPGAPPLHRDDQIMADLWQRLGAGICRVIHAWATPTLRSAHGNRRLIVGHYIRYALHDEHVYEFDRLLFDATNAVLSLTIEEIHALPRDRTLRLRLAADDPDVVPLNSPLAWSEDVDVARNVAAFFGVYALDQITSVDLEARRLEHGLASPEVPPVHGPRMPPPEVGIEEPF
jgi:hypothetical protein